MSFGTFNVFIYLMPSDMYNVWGVCVCVCGIGDYAISSFAHWALGMRVCERAHTSEMFSICSVSNLFMHFSCFEYIISVSEPHALWCDSAPAFSFAYIYDRFMYKAAMVFHFLSSVFILMMATFPGYFCFHSSKRTLLAGQMSRGKKLPIKHGHIGKINWI